MVAGACMGGVIDALCRQSLVTVSDSKTGLNSIKWLAIEVHHGMMDGGFATRVVMENAITDSGVSTIEEEN